MKKLLLPLVDYLRCFPGFPVFFVRCQVSHQEHR